MNKNLSDIKLSLIFLCVVFPVSCSKGESMNGFVHSLPSFDVSSVPPTCGQWRNHMPMKRAEEPYEIYLKARKRWRSKPAWLFNKEENREILHDVEYSAGKGDWGAIALLANFYLYGLGLMDSNHVLDPNPEKAISLVKSAVEAGQAWGFYDLGVAYEYGYGGVNKSHKIAWALYLKAAQLGSPEALMTLADAYARVNRTSEQEMMLQCAYKQGFGPAATQLGYIAAGRRPLDAVRFYQDGVMYGDSASASALYLIFGAYGNSPSRKELLKAIGSEGDQERARRYGQIHEALDANPDLRFGRLDKVLPLPPAALPEWRGIEAAMTPEPEGPPTY